MPYISQYKANITANDQNQTYEAFTDTIYPEYFAVILNKGTYSVAVARWQPNIDLTGRHIKIISAYVRMTCNDLISYDTDALVNINVHNGSCPALDTNKIIDFYSAIGTDIEWNTTGLWTKDIEYTTPDISARVQDWFNREGYAQTDWIGIPLALPIDGDAGGKEAYSYNGTADADKRVELEINYILGKNYQFMNNGDLKSPELDETQSDIKLGTFGLECSEFTEGDTTITPEKHKFKNNGNIIIYGEIDET